MVSNCTSNWSRTPIEKQFDGLGRPVTTIHNGVKKEEIFYDQYNRVDYQTYLPGNYTTYAYEPSPLNRAIRETYPDGNAQTMEYGREGNYFSMTATNERGFKTTTNTDILGRKSLVRNAIGGQTIWTYEDRGNVEEISSPTGVYRYTYDVRNRLTSKTVPGWDASLGREIYHYCDNTDQLTRKTDPNGNQLRYEYDPYGRLIKTYHTEVAPGSAQTGGSVCGPGAGGPVLETIYYPDQVATITTNRVYQSKAQMLGASGMVQSTYTYDAYGRASTLAEAYPTATAVNASDNYSYTYNHADWMLTEDRAHQSYQSVSVSKVWGYDNFGRITGEVFGGGVPLPGGSSTFGELLYTMTYNDRDQMVSMKYGGLPRFLDQAAFLYNERGWMTDINALVFAGYNVNECDIPPWGPAEPRVVESNLTFPELLEQLVRDPNFVIGELNPCNYGDCFAELADYRVDLPPRDCIEAVYLKDGKRIDLPGYPYCIVPTSQGHVERFVNDLKAWLIAQGYTFEIVEWIVDTKASPVALNYIRVTETDAPLGNVLFGCGYPNYNVSIKAEGVPVENIKINAIYDANGQLLSLPRYPYTTNTLSDLEDDIFAWFSQQSSFVNAVRVTVFRGGISIRLSTSYKPFGRVVFSYPDKTGKEIVKTTYFNVQCPLGGSQVFVRYNRKVVPCERLRKPDPGTDGEQPVSVVALDQAIASATAAGLTYPTVLYEVTLLNGQRRWVLREELAILRGRYKRGRRINITNAQEQLTIKKTNGDIVQVDVAGLLTTRAAGMLDEVLPPPGSNPQCGSFPPLGCNEIEQQQQQQSLAQILNEMAQLNALTLNYPVRLVLVRLCDGSTMYMLESMLTILEGPYLVLGSLDVNSPSQLFSGTVTENRDPIFAMTFPLFEPNGDIVRANWQVAYRHPQFYIYSYDALDRLTSGRYGEIVSEERQTANGFPFITRYDSYTDIYSVPNIQYDGAGNITSLQRMGRLNDNCGAGQIDALTYTYTEAPRLANVVDSAPDPGRPKGFRPGSVGRADYGYDYNGNLTSDPNKNLTIQYNFLNLPKMVNATPVVYDAAGRKWRWGSGPTARETFNGIDFVEGKLEGFLHDKGRIAPERNEFGGIARLRAEYWRQDHLGNTRVAFSDQNGDGFITTRDNPATPENDVEIMQENHYYPFGMNHDGRWFGPQDPENRYTYNGKEYNPELGLDWYDYGARWYDAALGRWGQVDPLAEKYADLSSYAYVANNPLIFIDPDGKRIDPSGILNSNNKLLIAAFIQFAKSEAGIELLSKFAQKGQTIAGHTFEEDGEFHQQGVTLSYHAWEGNYEDADGDKTNGGANGVTRTQEVEGGTLGIEVFINTEINSSSNPDAEAYEANPNKYTEGGYVSSRAGTLFHETVIHAAADAKDYIQDCRLNCSNTNEIHGKNPNTKEGRRIIQHLGAKDSNSEFRRKYIPAIISIYRQNGSNLSNHEIQRRLLNFQD